jgi:crotonobetainyl-CoA hydratase
MAIHTASFENSLLDDLQSVRVSFDGAVMTITIDRPAVLNALDPTAHAELARCFDHYAANPDLRVAVITGTGRAFCVGSDIKARAKSNADNHPPTGFGGITHRFDLFKPVIAAVNGLCLGGGVEILCACDLAVASENAQFGLPELRVGLGATGGGALQRLARYLPMKEAMGLALTAKRIGAAEAQRIGLINEVVPAAELQSAVRAMADEILACAPLSIEATKQVLLQSLAEPDLEKAIRAKYPAVERMLASEDAREGQWAFAEKRKPVWRGR